MLLYCMVLIWAMLELYGIPNKIKTSIKQYIARRKNRKDYEKHIRAVQKMKNK
jgi:hypothetical protein